MKVTLGIEELVAAPPSAWWGQRLGLLCNQASTDRNFRHGRELIREAFPGQLTCLFTPQHGFFAEKQDNMVESEHAVDAVSGVPVFSLYGEHRRPTPAMMAELDLLLVDLVDVGTRVYTFMSTLAYCLEAAAEAGKKVVILDRPNPIGGLAIEGNMLQEDCRSFVGLYPLPMRHGLTFAELALFLNRQLAQPAELEIVKMGGWRRWMLFADTGLPWVFPSPNMPSLQTALVYPGQVIWEGANVSEGRGTSLPFELFGAPYFRHGEIIRQLGALPLPGCQLRPVVFEPTSNKGMGQPCVGFQIHILDPREFLPYRTSLALLQAAMRQYPDDFQFKAPPYEYEYERLPMELIIGDRHLLQALAAGADLQELEREWSAELAIFAEARRQYFLYK